MIEKNKNNRFFTALISFTFVFILMLLFMAINKMAPFGDSTFAGMDANIQYADLFNYYRNVLEGKDSITFSLSNLLGDSGISIFGYYLASPLNLLILLFKRQTVGTIFFNLLFTLKVSLAGAFFSLFISYWFRTKNKPNFNIIFSICYALMQYNVSQASNIIWLDGVYMLPLVLLGVHKGVYRGTWHIFSITIACSLIFNWYTGIINCLFSFVWFLFELIYLKRKFIVSMINYLLASISGGLISGIIFYPVYKSMQESSRNGFDWSILRIVLNGNPLNTISNYALGAVSSQGSVSLYCGMLTIVLVVTLFFSSQIPLRTKAILGSLTFIVILLFYFVPLVFMFSIFKEVDSYWYRYSYIGCFTLLFLAQFYINNVEIEKNERKKLLGVALLLLCIELSFSILKKENVGVDYLLSGLFAVAAVLILIFANSIKSKRRANTLLLLLLALVSSELFINLKKEYAVYSHTTINAKTYSTYTRAESRLINSIKENDNSIYRISQTKTRLPAGDGTLTANYNESLGYNYPSISGYTSSPSESQLTSLDKFGYRTEQQRISIVNTSILPADSLLGVKYVLSPYVINGLSSVKGIPSQNGKKVLLNHYAFPLAFTGPAVNNIKFDGNTFNYQEKVIDNLVGENLKIYEPISFAQKRVNDSLTFRLFNEGKGPVYGSLPWNKDSKPNVIYANGREITAYSQWLSPSVFYIPGNATRIELRGTAYSTTPEFYRVNLKQLEKAHSIVKRRTIRITRLGLRSFSLNVNGDSKPYLYSSIPNSKNWIVQNNGKQCRHLSRYGIFMQIPLHSGNNHLILKYHNPGTVTGIIMSLVGVFLAAVQFLNNMVKDKNDSKKFFN